MSIRNFITVALGCFLLTLSGASGAWSVNDNYDNQPVGADCGSFSKNQYQDTKVTSENSSSGSKSCKMIAYQGNSGHGGAFKFPANLHKGDEYWMRFRMFMPAGYDYGVYSNGNHLKWIGIDTNDTNNVNSSLYLELTREDGGEPPYGAILTNNNNCSGYQTCWQFFGTANQKPQRGVWETYEVYYKLDNIPVSQGGTGRIRVWKNGVLVGDLTRWGPLNNATDYVDVGRILTYWNGGPSKTQHLYIDDLVATNDTPSARDANGNPYIGVGNFVAVALPLPPSSIQ